MRNTIVILTFFLEINLFSQQGTISFNQVYYEVAPTYEFKEGILSLTFDDGIIQQFTKAMPLLTERNIIGTFYVISGQISENLKNGIKKAQIYQHEIGSHTVNHPNLRQVNYKTIQSELFQSQKDLNAILNGNYCKTIAYPFGRADENVIGVAKELYLGGRSCEIGYNPINFFDRYLLRVQSFTKQTSVETANSWVEYSLQNKVWAIEVIHQVIEGLNAIDSKTFIDHIDFIHSKQDKIWCTSISNVLKYNDEFQNAVITCEACNNMGYSIKIDDNLDDSIFNQPLTIKLKIPNNWDSIRIVGGNYVKLDILDSVKFLVFNALPNNQLITIEPGSLSFLPESDCLITLLSVYPNPFESFINVTIEVFKKTKLRLSLCSMSGLTLVSWDGDCLEGVSRINLDTSDCPRGIYFLKILGDDGRVIMNKIVKF